MRAAPFWVEETLLAWSVKRAGYRTKKRAVLSHLLAPLPAQIPIESCPSTLWPDRTCAVSSYGLAQGRPQHLFKRRRLRLQAAQGRPLMAMSWRNQQPTEPYARPVRRLSCASVALPQHGSGRCRPCASQVLDTHVEGSGKGACCKSPRTATSSCVTMRHRTFPAPGKPSCPGAV